MLLLLIVLVQEYKCGQVIKKTTTSISKNANYHIQFDETQLICKVSRKFVSVAFSAGQLNKTSSGYDPSNAKLRKLMKALAPMYVRVGGTRANFMNFEPRDSSKKDDDDEDEKPDKPEDVKTKEIPADFPSLRLASRAIVPQPSEDDVDRYVTHKFKRFTLDLPKIPKRLKKQKKKAKGKDDADELTDEEKEKKKKEKKQKKFAGYKNYNITADQFDSLYHLINGTGNSMLFDVSAFTRVDNSKSWDSSNAEKLIEYAENMGYSVDWELGNEPNHYKKFGKKRQQTGKEVGDDYVSFKSLVKSKMPNAKIVGPEVTRPKSKGKVEDWLSGFLDVAGDSIDALSWHQYYLDGKKASDDDFVNGEILDRFVAQNDLMGNIVRKNNFTKPVWITETGSAWGGGADGLSNRFAGLFPYVDKLGVAGNNCVHVVARQAFLAGKYAMVNKTNYSPHPEYFGAVLFKRLAANGILKMSSDKQDSNFRIYARCARTSKHTLPGSVFIFVLNLYDSPKSFAFPVYELFKVKQYLLTADSLRSDTVLLNGKPLQMEDNGESLPHMKPVEVEQPIKLPGHSIGFYILDLVSLNIC